MGKVQFSYKLGDDVSFNTQLYDVDDPDSVDFFVLITRGNFVKIISKEEGTHVKEGVYHFFIPSEETAKFLPGSYNVELTTKYGLRETAVAQGVLVFEDCKSKNKPI